MHDIRGIFRSHCTECGTEVCTEFLRIDNTFCGYCGCPPTKHKPEALEKIQPCSDVSVEDAQLNDVQVAMNKNVPSSFVVPIEDIQLVDVHVVTNENMPSRSVVAVNDVQPKNNCSLDVLCLPNFSKCVEDALINGNIKTKLWCNMIVQCAAFFIDCPVLNNKTAYNEIGRKMFEKYPCIGSTGPKPWSQFVKALSQKIRKERMKKKSFVETANHKNFCGLITKAGGGLCNTPPSEKTKIGDCYSRVYSRSQAAIAPAGCSEMGEAKKGLLAEWKQPVPEKALIKSYLRDTFEDRSLLLQKNVSFSGILTSYPCFEKAEHLLYEYSIMIGAKAMENVKRKMKDFIQNIQKARKCEDCEDVLGAWMWFEKLCGIYQTKSIKSSPIIEVIYDDETYRLKVTNVLSMQPPCAVVLLKDGKVCDCCLLHDEHFISVDESTNILYLLTALLATYYCLELNYPKQYVQAMGALGYYVLGHSYYKLGVRAKKMLAALGCNV